MPTVLYFTVLALASAICFIAGFFYTRPRAPLPPGPRGLPFIGNLLDMPRSRQWLVFAQWKSNYGDLIHLSLLGTPLLILNSAPHALALLNKLSATSSDRPPSPVGAYIGYVQQIVLAPYSARTRAMRRMFARLVGSNESLARFTPLVEAEEARMVVGLWRDSGRAALAPESYVRRAVGAISLEMAYGYKVKGDDDYFVRLAERAVRNFVEVTTPGAFLADTVPLLLHVPAWLPGAGWKRKLIQWRNTHEEFSTIPFEWTKRQIAAGSSEANMVTMNLENETDTEHEGFVKLAVSQFYGGASDTAVSAISSFFLAMMLHPEVQRKAYDEIDAVVGRDRLPTYSERASLPYVEAIFKEILRWNPVAPLGAPHRLSEDTVYEGYILRKGTVVIPNIWLFFHDPKTYKDPYAFKPERFLASGEHEPEPDPRTYAFGFGRRVCPGQLLGEMSLYMACVLSLAALTISPAKGEPPMDVEDITYSTGLISHPPPFRCCIEPRDAAAERLLGETEATLCAE